MSPGRSSGSPSPRSSGSLPSTPAKLAAASATTSTPSAPIAPTAMLPEVVLQLRLALPATLTYLFGRSMVSISLVFIGRMGDLPLAAAALANTTSNVSGLSIIVGMGTAVSTICGQAYGAGNYRKVSETLQLAVLVNWAVCVPISILWWNAEAVLLLCGQDTAVAAASGEYMRWLIPFIWCFAFQGALNAYLNAQRLMKPGAAASVLIAPIHFGVCLVMFDYLASDYLGGAQAMAVSGVIQTVLMLVIVHCSGLHKKTWFGLSARCFDDARRFCALALAGVISLSEWWASEICILLAGLLPLPELTVATMSIFQITIGQCFYFSLGIGIACSTRVANLLGAGEPAAAKLAARAAISSGACVLAMLFSMMQLMRHQLPLIYTDDDVLRGMMAENFFVAAFCACPEHRSLRHTPVSRSLALDLCCANRLPVATYTTRHDMIRTVRYSTIGGYRHCLWPACTAPVLHLTAPRWLAQISLATASASSTVRSCAAAASKSWRLRWSSSLTMWSLSPSHISSASKQVCILIGTSCVLIDRVDF